MQSTSTSAAAAATTWGATAKTVAMGAAGTVLWGSLAFYFAVGMNNADEITNEDQVETAERLFFRTELPEADLVQGCQLNNGAGACDGTAWIILSQHQPRQDAPPMPEALKVSMPTPLWDNVTERNDMTDRTCNRAITVELPRWLATVPRASEGVTLALLPEHLGACQASAPGIDPRREHRNFWFISGQKVVGELRCSLPGTYMEPACELAAYPEHGTFEVSYSRLPAANVEAIATQAPQMLEALKAALPADLAARVDLDTIPAPVAFDADTAAAMGDLVNVSF
ncbi:hypothetical protein [Pseudooceanicola onchidii]|uniref:hypothetical protein n=1 Tax=Pseudooceanicola onchidii TaxID=2562279 RepID=UPI0010AB18EA|nr:hypothetical protein [Pseudooceanicola onchidii]